MTLVERLFGTHSERELKIIQKTVDKIVALRGSMQELSDEELRAKTDEFKQRLANGETLDDILVEAFAVVREGAKRSIGLEPYPVQLIGGIVAHQGRIAEMRTGEGKSLTCALPSYLNALEGKGVHVVTVNDYLAKRDADEMGQLHRFLGLTVSCITHDMTPDQRKAAYNADITYVTNNELGFDYLRDNMAIHKTQLVQRGLHYAIIDEIDSILIDEARTPLIISGQGNTSTQLYILCDTLATQLEKGTFQGELNKLDILLGDVIEEDGDYIVDEKDKVVTLTERGVHKVEKFFGIDNLADIENIEIQHNMELALRANNLMLRDRDYIVTDDGEVQIVDEFTGRVMPGRRFSDGLHQAIEAKERVKIKSESRTLATITFQNFFNKYDKKSGMTGTALTEEREFRDIYGLDVIVIPTNRPIKRVDHNDAVYKTQREKYNAILNDVRECYRRKQPVLVGTANIEVSELLSTMFRRAGIPHEVLNAKNHAKEAEIVAKAGQKGAVTIATNMAGRGTDIKLGEGVAELGGLKIIGSERHESRRIDNQLRGRSGRQGDHGESKFYISLEDDLMRLFSSENAIKMLESLGVPDGEEIQHKILTSAIEKAQKKVEGNNYAIRKRLIDYDIINNEQRELIYKERMQVLDGQDMKETIINMMTDMLEVAIDENIVDGKNKNGWNTEGLEVEINRIIPLGHIDISSYSSKNEISEAISDMAIKFYDEREKDFGDPEAMRGFERFLLLKVIDAKWIEHIDNMEHLRMGIGLQAYAQKDPVVEYKTQAYDMFNEMSHNIKYDTVRKVFQTRVERVEKV